MKIFDNLVGQDQERSWSKSVSFGLEMLIPTTTAIGITIVGSPGTWARYGNADFEYARFVIVFLVLLLGSLGYIRAVKWRLQREEERAGRVVEEHLIETTDRFIANVSHGLRTPLTGIVGFIHILKSSISKPEDLEAVDMILAESADLSRIVDDLLMAARLETGTLEIKVEEVSFSTLVEKTLDFMDLLGVEIALDCVEAQVQIDQERFRQVLRNLLVNAHRHGRPQVALRGLIRDGRYVCHVIDHGSGVPAELHNRIFQRFTYQRDRGITGHVGLGLAIVQQLCKLMDCEVGYRRIRGETHFLISMPLAQEHAESDDDPSVALEVIPERPMVFKPAQAGA